jgi:poly(3-hydroxybutyrate) depolymerase
LFLAGEVCGAAAVKVNFILNTADPYGAPLVENRYYYVYRPDAQSLSTPVPMILVMEASPNSGAATMLNAKAAQAGFVVVSCSFSGNSTGTPGTVWNNDNPNNTGFEDFDYITEVINRVRASDNCNDAFITGISKGGHMTFAYACVRPSMIRAAGPLDEFMSLTSNIPSSPVPIIVFQGTADANVPYMMVKESADAWLAKDGLLNTDPVTTYEASPLIPGMVTQTTWRGGIAGTQVAFVTITGGTHTYPTPGVQTGYNFADGLWAFFSQYLSSTQAPPRIVSQPVNNIQPSGQPASFWVTATGQASLKYQWQKNGSDIPGATDLWYTTPPTTLADNGATFRAVVSNNYGADTSYDAVLTVNAGASDPVITLQPADQSAMGGQPVSFSVAASGTVPLSYQWMKNGVSIAGETLSSLSLQSASTSDGGATFRVRVSNGAGSVTSVAATLTVKPSPGAPIIITNPERSRVLVNQAGVFSITAQSPSPMVYQWQKGTFATAANLVSIPGANASTYTTPPTTLADNSTLFRCVVTNLFGSVTSASEMLAVTTSVVSPKQITSDIHVSGQVGVPFSYSIKSSGGTAPIVYRANPLPSGLVVDSGTGMITGTPTVADTSSVLLVASNSAGNASATLKLTVTDALGISPSREKEVKLNQNYPNPFNNSTSIIYSLAHPGNVKLSIYSISGQKIATLMDKSQSAGMHSVMFDARQLASGTYVYWIETPGFSKTGPTLLILRK